MKKIVTTAITATVVLGLAGCAYAQLTNEEESAQLENMVVTAQKREENPQKVPISMDVLSATNLEDASVRNTVDMIKLSPNVFIKESHVEHALVIRGISSFSSSMYSPAGFYVDDVSYPLHYMQNVALFDVERVEVLKGPQGTLYGRNSESGVLNIVTRQPGEEFEAAASGEYGSYNSSRFDANIKGPVISDTLYFGGAFQFYGSDGYTENISNGDDSVMDKEHLNGRAILRWTPSDPWDVSFIMDIQKYDDHGGGWRYIDGPKVTEAYEVRKDTDEYVKQDANTQTVRVKYEADAFNVLSVTSAIYQTLDKQNDSDVWDSSTYQTANIFKVDERQYSQELRISSPENETFEWLAGVYAFSEDTTFDMQFDIVSSVTTSMHTITDIDSSGYAAFGQGTYTPMNRLHLTAGLRFDHQEMDGEQGDSVRNTTNSETLSFDEFLPKVALNYDVSEDMMGYVSASKGYLVGGFNWINSLSTSTFVYDPEYTWNYEAGIKAAWCSGRIISNISVFYIDITDKQVTEYDSDTMNKTVTNAAKAHSHGMELQLRAKPVAVLELFAGFGYTKSTFDEYKATVWSNDYSALVEEDYDGNDLPYAPRYTYNLGAQYRHSSGFFGRVDFFGTDRFYGDSANTASQDSYETMNLKLGYEQERYDVYLWVKNVFDEEHLTSVGSYNGYTIGLDGDPQTFGLTLNYRF